MARCVKRAVRNGSRFATRIFVAVRRSLAIRTASDREQARRVLETTTLLEQWQSRIPSWPIRTTGAVEVGGDAP
jgi:hypothetical protein